MKHEAKLFLSALLTVSMAACGSGGGGSPTVQNTVALTSSSTKIDYTAHLDNLTPTQIPSGKAAITLDWGGLTTNALGRDFDPTSITNLFVGHYTQSPSELQGSLFLMLDLIATDLYKGCVGDSPCKIPSGTSVDFSQLQTDGGKSFPGIDSSGTWIAALQCGGCKNPAPLYLTILKPCDNNSCGSAITAAQSNDYSFSSTITLPPVTVMAKSNFTIDWSGVTKDLIQHPVDPKNDLSTVLLLLFTKSLPEVETAVNEDSLAQSDIYVVPPPTISIQKGMTSAHLYDFTVNGTTIPTDTFNQYFDPSMNTFTYVVAVASGDTLGQGIRMLQSIDLK